MHKYPKPKKKQRPTAEERAKARAKSAARRKMTRGERILDDARNNPSPTCRDRRQLDLLDAIKQRAFAALDQSIKEVLAQADVPTTD